MAIDTRDYYKERANKRDGYKEKADFRISESEFRRRAYRRGWARNFKMAFGAACLMFAFFKLLGALIDYLRM